MALILAHGLLALAAGCDACQGAPAVPAETRPPPEDRPSPSPSEVFVPPDPSPAGEQAARRILPAFSPDHAHAGERPVAARRLIYRLSLLVPPVFGPKRKAGTRPSTELVVDVSDARLRARFEGAGWPVPDGAEVRLRRDQPGVYVFDARGGRPLGPGQMATWFEGGRVRRFPGVRLRAPGPDEQVGPGDLLCRLIAEWANHATDRLAHRCGEGGSLSAFRVGPWRADRTADVALKRPRSALRADHHDPPEPPETPTDPTPVTLHGLDALRPLFRVPASEPGPHPLVVRNEGSARALVIVEGVPVRWLETDEAVTLRLPVAGIYRVGAMRPLGSAVLLETRTRAPGEVVLER
ncbi:MAG: hypothetical protein ACODAU_12955 [Myxococcota bacterium]